MTSKKSPGYSPVLHIYLHTMRAYFRYAPTFFDTEHSGLFNCYSRLRETLILLPSGSVKIELFLKLHALEQANTEDWLPALADLQLTTLIDLPNVPFVKQTWGSSIDRFFRRYFTKDIKKLKIQRDNLLKAEPDEQILHYLKFVTILVSWFLPGVQRKRFIPRMNGLLKEITLPLNEQELYLLLLAHLLFFQSSIGLVIGRKDIDRLIKQVQGTPKHTSSQVQEYVEKLAKLSYC